MKHINKRESPPPQIELKESPTLIRAIATAYADEVTAITDYTYGQILFEKWLPNIANILETLSRAEMHHFLSLGRLLRDLGAPPVLHTMIASTPYRLNEDADSHAPVLAQRVLKERIRDEKNASLQYKKLAEHAVTERARSLLSSLAEDEQDHAAVLESIAQRLAFS
jgi:rubrerythrin